MNSHTYDYDYIDGNAAAGELSNIFAMDVTVAEGQCAHCGATRRFAEAHLYMQAPGVVARCAVFCARMTMFLLATRQIETHRSKRRFAIVNRSYLETKRNVLKSTISES